MTWYVPLTGRKGDLAVLARLFQSDPRVQHQGGSYYLLYSGRNELDGIDAVLDRARHLLDLLSAITTIIDSQVCAVTAGTACLRVMPDGRRLEYPEAPSGLGGRTVPGNGPREAELAAQSRTAGRILKDALGDEIIARALRQWASVPRGWRELVNILGIIEADVGKPVHKMSWTSGQMRTHFQRTASHPEAAGDLARHGYRPHESPDEPMTLHEADRLVRQLLAYWMEHRFAHSSGT